MKKFLLLLLSCSMASIAHAQITAIIPAATATTQGVVKPDGTTIKVAAGGVLSCVVPGSAAVTYDGKALTVGGVQVNALSLTNLILTGGTATQPNTQYIISTDASNVGSLVPFLPESPSAGSTYTLAIPAQAAWAVTFTPLPGVVVKPGQVYSVTPVFAGVPGTTLNYLNGVPFVNSTGALYLRVSNGSGAATPATSWTVTIR